MVYNFDEIIDRKHTNSLNTDGYKQYMFSEFENLNLKYIDDELIRMWVADMEFATPDFIINGIKDRLSKRIFGYTKIFEDSYYKAFSDWCIRRYGWAFFKNDLRTSNGIIPALYELVEYITLPNEKVIFTTPSYSYFQKAADYNSRGFETTRLINSGGYYMFDFDDFEKKAKNPDTTLFIFCHPHNPTGRVWTKEELEKIGKICIENDLWIISDEIHCDLLRQNKKHIPLASLFPDYDKIITCMAPSKTFNTAGLMFSNIIIPNVELRAKWDSRHYGFDNPLSIAAAEAAYTYGDKWLNELSIYLDDNFNTVKRYLNQNLPNSKFYVSEATYLAWVDVSAYFTKEENLPLFFAENAGVLLEGGNMFVENSDCFIRLNLASPRSLVEEGIKRIVDAINKK